MMFRILVILALATVFCLSLASFAWEDMLTGLALSAGLVALLGRAVLPTSMPRAEYVIHIIVYSPVFLWMMLVDIVKGTWQVAAIVVGIRPLTHPGIVRIPVGNHSPPGVGIVGLIVTFSPGSFLVDIDWEERVMLVHYIDASNPAQLRADVEKYYRLWEYGQHLPESAGPSAGIEERP